MSTSIKVAALPIAYGNKVITVGEPVPDDIVDQLSPEAMTEVEAEVKVETETQQEAEAEVKVEPEAKPRSKASKTAKV